MDKRKKAFIGLLFMIVIIGFYAYQEFFMTEPEKPNSWIETEETTDDTLLTSGDIEITEKPKETAKKMDKNNPTLTDEEQRAVTANGFIVHFLSHSNKRSEELKPYVISDLDTKIQMEQDGKSVALTELSEKVDVSKSGKDYHHMYDFKGEKENKEKVKGKIFLVLTHKENGWFVSDYEWSYEED